MVSTLQLGDFDHHADHIVINYRSIKTCETSHIWVPTLVPMCKFGHWSNVYYIWHWFRHLVLSFADFAIYGLVI